MASQKTESNYVVLYILIMCSQVELFAFSLYLRLLVVSYFRKIQYTMRTSCTAAKFYPFYCKILQVNKRAGVFVIGKCRIVGKSLEPINKTQTHKLGIL